MGFLRALLGGLYYAGKYVDERSTSKQCRDRRAKYNEIDEQIRIPAGNRNYDAPGNREQFWIMAESIQDDLEYIFGETWRAEINFPLIYDYFGICNGCGNHCGEAWFSHNLQIVYEVWLAKQGYLANRRQGFSTASIHGIATEQSKGIALRACQVIEKNLQAAHPALPLRLRINPNPMAGQGPYPYGLEWEHYTLCYDGDLGERPW